MTDRLRTTLFLMPADLLGEGVDQVVRTARELGVDALALAGVYHASRDVLPHSTRFRVFQSVGGASFVPMPELYDEHAAPPRMPEAGGRDLLDELCSSATAAGLAVDAWTVYLHADRWEGTESSGAVVNAFGDVYPHLRCPSSAHTQRYARALTHDLARRPIRRIIAEGLHWYSLDHGYHHERTAMVTTPASARLLALCFCSACATAAADRGIDCAALAAWCRRAIDAELDPAGPAAPDVTPSSLEAFLQSRVDTVTGLSEQCAHIAAAAGKEFCFVDLSAGSAGWADGQADGPLGVDRGRDLGIEAARIGAQTSVAATIYTADHGRFAQELSAFRRVVGPGRLSVILRPARPDIGDTAALTARLRSVRSHGVGEVAFYQYGLATATELRQIPAALEMLTDSAGPNPEQETSA